MDMPSPSSPEDAPLRYSVVVPVYNEGANIGPFCRRALAELPPGYELLICYDFEGDDTLPALAALSAGERPALVRPVKNGLGRGVRYAIEAGMRAARAPVVVVMMADLSDDFPKVAEMVRRAEAGADVVAASRYMRGGRQIGGPWLKGLLSRAAGLSLYWLAGLPTRDPTNSFKAYRREFLGRTPIESTQGFCLALELTAKAHFGGGRVEEVPAEWHDRAAGTSRFRLWAWLPHYLHWFLWALRERHRANFRAALLALAVVAIFLTHVRFPDTAGDAELDPSWQMALGHAFRQNWRVGVDYVFTYGPLGFLLPGTFDPGLFALKVVWEVGIAGAVSWVSLGVLRSGRPWQVRAGFALLLTLLSRTLIIDAKYLFLTTAAALPLLLDPMPKVLRVAAALGLLTLFAMTKFSFLLTGGVLGALLIVHTARAQGWLAAGGLTAMAVAGFGLLWVAAGQPLAGFAPFLSNSLELSGSYSEGMSLFGRESEVAAAVAAGLLLVAAAALRAGLSPGRGGGAYLVAAVAWMSFAVFKLCFVRHVAEKAETFFWYVGVATVFLWPRDGLRDGWEMVCGFLLAVLLATALYGALPLSGSRWSLPFFWARAVGRSASDLLQLPGAYASLERQRENLRADRRLPDMAAAVGNDSVDLLTDRQGVLLLNGFRWTPRPVFQSYVTVSPRLQRLNQDFFRSPSAPEYVILSWHTIDDRLPTLDDGPALLEILHRYRFQLTERGDALLRRRPDPVPDPLGPLLLERSVQFGEGIDLAALSPGAKALSFEIADSAFGRFRRFLYKPPPVDIELTFQHGDAKTFRVIPGMFREPVLIDPLPRTQSELAQLVTGNLHTRVVAVKLSLRSAGHRDCFSESVECKVWSLPGLQVAVPP